MAGLLFYRKYWNKDCFWFILLKMLKQNMAEDLFHSEDENKLPMGIHFIENAEMRYSWRFIAFKKA